MEWTLQEINEYLFYEFGIDTEYEEGDIHPPITDNWPFQLKGVGKILDNQQECIIYQFDDADDSYYVDTSDALTYYPVAGMSVDDLQIQSDGKKWISSHDPIDLSMVILNDENIPNTPTRRNHITTLAKEYLGNITI